MNSSRPFLTTSSTGGSASRRAPRCLLVFICLVVASGKTVFAAPLSVATVQLVSAAPLVRHKGASAFAPLRVRTSLYIGDVVRTGPNSKVNLLFEDGSQVWLNANSTIEITAPVGVGRGRTSLFRAIGGEMWSRLRPGQAVQTPHAVAGVRGTEFDLKIADDQSTTLSVVEGEVEFYNDLGTVFVEPSEQSVARQGAAPTKPITIDNPGLIVEWTAGIDRAVITREKFFVSLDRSVLKAETERRKVAVQQKPKDTEAHLDYGDALFDLRRFNEALSQYETADTLAPQKSETLVREGDANVEWGRLDEAEADFNAAQAQGSTAPALIGMAWLQLSRNRPDLAVNAARDALKLAGENSENGNEAKVALGVALLRQTDRQDEAQTVLESVGASSSEALGYQAHAWLAMLFLARDDNEAALREAQLAAKQAPYSALAHGNLALVSLYRGETRIAEREARLASQIDPDSVAARVAFAQVLLVQGDVDAAARNAAQAVALDPRLPQARYLLGLADAQRLDYIHAARSFREALAIAPDDLPAASALARVLTRMGQPEKAVALLQDMLPRNPHGGAVQGALGEVYYQQGHYELSASSYRTAAKFNPGSALYQAGLARTLLDGNQLNASIEAGQKAVHLAPTVGQYHAILGLTYEYSGLSAQAERQFREALIHDPQNALALAQLAYKHEGADLRPAAAGFAQSFLLDPAIGDQLLRGGVNLELTPQVGTEGQRGLDVTHRATALDGRLHSFAFATHSSGDLDRTNTDNRVTDGAGYLTYIPGPRTNTYFTLRGRRTTQGLGGATTTPSADDDAAFKFGQSEIAVRQRLKTGQTLWAGLFGNASRSDIHNPQLDSFFDNNTGLPVAGQRFTSHAIQPEIRLDLAVNRTGKQPGLLTLGAAHAPTSFSSLRQLQYPILSSTARARYDQDDRSTLLYAQLDKRFSDRLSLVSQLRWQHLDTINSGLITLPGSADTTLRSSQDKSRLLPSVLATYQLRERTSLRLSYNQRVTDVTTSTLAPVETLLTTESGMLPAGTPDLLKLAQLDVEHAFGSGDFLKLFLFRSTANTVQIGGTDLLGFGGGLPAADAPLLNVTDWRSSGLGARYEHQLGRSLFATAGVVLRDANSRPVAGASGSRAPYESSLLGNLGLNYIDPSGNKVALQLRHVGSFFEDTPLQLSRQRFGEQTYVDLRLAREASLSNEFFVNVTNLFDKRDIAFDGFPLAGRQIEFGLTRRF